MLSFRLALASDSSSILAWRNDPVARSMSLNTHIVDPASHAGWFAASLTNPDRIMVIGEETRDGTLLPVAIVRFDIEDHDAVVAINLDPSVRGRGLATHLLLGAEAFLPRGRPLTLIAEIRSENVASRCAFERAGYRAQAAPNDAPSSTSKFYKIRT